MKAIREVSNQYIERVDVKWRRGVFDSNARDRIMARLYKAQNTSKTNREGPGQFVRFCVVGTCNAIIDFGVLNAALVAFPTKETGMLLAYNTIAVVLAATNSFVWNRYFTFRVRGPLRMEEIARFVVVSIGTAILNDLVLLTLSGLFPALMASSVLGADVLKLGAILGVMALSFFGMRCWVFLGRKLSSDLPEKARGLPSLSDRASKDNSVQESLSIVSLKQRMEVLP